MRLKLQYFSHLMGSWLIGKDPDAGRNWGQEKKGTTENEMAGWHHRLYGHESEWTPGVGDGQGGLACCDSCGRRESDTTEQLNWLNWMTSNVICTTQCHTSIFTLLVNIDKSLRHFLTFRIALFLFSFHLTSCSFSVSFAIFSLIFLPYKCCTLGFSLRICISSPIYSKSLDNLIECHVFKYTKYRWLQACYL